MSSEVKLDNPSTIKKHIPTTNDHNEDNQSPDSYEESLVPPLPPYIPGLKKGKGVPLVSFGHLKTQMGKPPQFWGASNSNWKRKQHMNQDQGSTYTQKTGDSGQSRRIKGPFGMASQVSRHSKRSIKRKTLTRRTGDPPDVLSSTSTHSISYMTSRSRQVAQPRKP